MRLILGALVATAVLGGISASQPADARCFWNGFAMECYRSFDPEMTWGYHQRLYVRPFYRDFDEDGPSHD